MSKNEQKINVGSLKHLKISVHGTWNPAILRPMVTKCELVLWGTSPVDWIRLIGPFKPYLAENIFLQSSNCNILGLGSSSLTKPDLLRFRCSSGHVLSKTKSVTPYFFYIFDIANSSSFNGKIFRKKINVRKISRERPQGPRVGLTLFDWFQSLVWLKEYIQHNFFDKFGARK